MKHRNHSYWSYNSSWTNSACTPTENLSFWFCWVSELNKCPAADSQCKREAARRVCFRETDGRHTGTICRGVTLDQFGRLKKLQSLFPCFSWAFLCCFPHTGIEQFPIFEFYLFLNHGSAQNKTHILQHIFSAPITLSLSWGYIFQQAILS